MFIHVRTLGFRLFWGLIESSPTAEFSGSVHGKYAWVCIFACATCVHRPARRYELFKFMHCIGIRAEMNLLQVTNSATV